MKTFSVYSILFSLLFISACNHDQVTTDHLDGYVQKGPFLNGTEITLSGMSEDLILTGQIFTTQISDNRGSFSFNNLSLSSAFAELKADGFYFNEVKNESSAARLSLYAVADLTGQTSLNVNILSTLEKSRIAYLTDQGASFSEAKQQAESEVLNIFEIHKPDIAAPEKLDITAAGDDNAILLAISSIMQGQLTVAELSELVANIGSDIREDGSLDSMALGSILVNNARYLNLNVVRQNLEGRYAGLGADVTIPDFEKYVQFFLDSTRFDFTANIDYPQNGAFGTNLLDRDKSEYSHGIHSLCAILPAGASLKVKLFGVIWGFPVSQDWSGWNAGDYYNPADTAVTLISKKTGRIDLQVMVEMDTTSIKPRVTVYENGADKPTWSKDVTIK